MTLLLFAALGIAGGLLSGGRLQNAAKYPLKGLFLPIVALAVKAGAAFFFTPQAGALAVCFAQYALLFAFVAINRKRPLWPAVVGAGSLLNFLVIAWNGGCMPVAARLVGNNAERIAQLAQGEIYAYTLATQQTRLAFLGDVIRLGPVGQPLGFASAGDLILCAGVAALCWQMLRYRAAEHSKPNEFRQPERQQTQA